MVTPARLVGASTSRAITQMSSVTPEQPRLVNERLLQVEVRVQVVGVSAPRVSTLNLIDTICQYGYPSFFEARQNGARERKRQPSRTKRATCTPSDAEDKSLAFAGLYTQRDRSELARSGA